MIVVQFYKHISETRNGNCFSTENLTFSMLHGILLLKIFHDYHIENLSWYLF